MPETTTHNQNPQNENLAVPANGAARLIITDVSGSTIDQNSYTEGMELVPQGTKTFTPSTRYAPKDYEGHWISATKYTADGEYKGVTKVRVEDGYVVNALSDRLHIVCEQVE